MKWFFLMIVYVICLVAGYTLFEYLFAEVGGVLFILGAVASVLADNTLSKTQSENTTEDAP